jgi:ATP-dependent DNA helicase RecG
MQYENERVEYKEKMIDDIYKEVIAFANTDGGIIYIVSYNPLEDKS